MNILLSFAGDKTSIVQYFKHAIGNTGKIYTCDSLMNFSLTQADGYLITPHEYDDSYITALTDYCKKNSISAIIPLSDADLSVLSKNKNKLHDIGISAIVSDESVIDICIDRWKAFHFLKSIGVKQPKSYINMEEAKQDIVAGTLSFPLFLKPRIASERTNEIDVNSLEELGLFYRKMQQSISNYPVLQKDKNIIIQEEFDGEKYGLCLFNDLQGNIETSVALKILSGSNTNPIIAQVVDTQPFENIQKLISSELKHVACLELNCCLQKSGEVIISEIYARFGNCYPFGHVAGVDFPKQIIDWLNGLPSLSDYICPEIGVKGCKEKLFPVHFDF